MIVQFVSMGVKSAQNRELEERIADVQRRIDEGEKDLEWYQSGEGLYYLARRMGKK